MKRKIKQIVSAISVAALAGLALAPAADAAGTATLSFSPSSGKIVNGNTLAVGVYENSGTDDVNAVQANFSYPDTLLECISVANSSAFTVAPQSVCSGGSVMIGRGAYTPVSGSQLVATVYFKALAGSGTAALDFDSSSSKVVRSSDHLSETLTVQNASYSLSAPAAPQSGGSTSNTSTKSSTSSSDGSAGTTSGSGTSNAAKSTTTKTTAPPKLTVSNVAISNVTANSATVTWQTSVPASSEVDYGPNTTYGLSVVSQQLTTNHSLALNSKDLRPSLVYHFAVKSIDAGGQSAVSSDQTFETTADGSLAGQPADQTKTYLIIAVAAIGAIGIIAVAAAWYIRRMHHAAALLDSHAFHTSPPSGAILPPIGAGGMITPTPSNLPSNPPQTNNGNPPNSPNPPGAAG